VETVIGAVVGMLVNVPFPRPVQRRYAGQAVARPAEEMAALLGERARQLPSGTSTEGLSTAQTDPGGPDAVAPPPPHVRHQ
jgi:hypothetical protein